MRTIQVPIFKYTELSNKTKEKARYDQASDLGYFWEREAMDSIKALAAHFDCRIDNWNIDWFQCSRSYASFAVPDGDSMLTGSGWTKKEIRRRLNELGTYNRKTLKGHGECKLTGFCMDEDAIDGFRIAFIRDKITDLEALMQAAFDSWLKAAQADCAHQYSDEAFAENCEANEYEFYEDGSFA